MHAVLWIMKKSVTLIVALFCFALSWAEGELDGRFQINAAGDLICFSKGNLVYTQTTDTWSFAEHQYDVIGAANLETGTSTLADKIDLFGWSADGNMADPYGISNTNASSHYRGDFVEWGDNQISNGGNKPYVWRTLSAEEWTYLLNNHVQFATAINGVSGIALVPQKTTLTESEKKASYTVAEWQDIENKGVVFLPLTGYRSAGSSSVTEINTVAYYWTSTKNGTDNAMIMRCNTTADAPTSCARKQGNPVRLVKQASSCTVTVKAVPNIAGAGTFSITVIE